MANKNLSDAAKEILSLQEDSKSEFDANIRAKQGMRGQSGTKPEVGASKLPASVAYGEKDAGVIGQSPEKEDDSLPDYLKGTPTATPPGATPPVGSEKDGVGYTHPKGQPQETMGRKDVMHAAQRDADYYENIRDRVATKLPANTFHPTPGSKGVQSYHEDIEAMLSGENLSEEFKEKATTIFEAAVLARAEEVIAEAEQTMMEQFEAAVEEIKNDLTTKLDDYLNYMVEEWMENNEVAIEYNLRSEIAEEFMTGLKGLFEEHYINIPEEQDDIIGELAAKVEELEEQLNGQIKESVEMKKELNMAKKIKAIRESCEGLTQTQVEKMVSLAEGVDFTTEEEFADKLEVIRESYFKPSVVVASSDALNEEIIIEEEKQTNGSVDPMMSAYASAISKTISK